MPNPPTTFSYSFDVTAPGPPPETELFAMDRWDESPLPDGQVRVRNPHNGSEMQLPQEVINATSYCREFRSLPEHVDVLMEGLDDDPARAAAIESVLKSIREGGLAVSARDVCRKLAPFGSAAPIDHKPVVVVVTCDRPETLERILDSILANCNMESVDCCFVIDDSRDADNSARNHEITAAAGARAPGSIHYFGAVQSRDLVDALITRLPTQEESIRFLLDRERWRDHASHGVARNYSHLLSVGKPVVVFDDDSLCEAYEAPLGENGVEFSRRHRDALFYSGDEEWRELRAQDGADPVGRHMQCLGLTIPAALGVLGVPKLGQESLRHATPEFARSLGGESRVLITECGTLGDPGTGGNDWMVRMPAESRDRLLQVPGRLRQALDSRSCWHGARRAVFRPEGNMSGVTGFDNRWYLPPYFPVTRGEDQLFGYLTSRIHPGSVVLDYPWAVPHLPPEERRWTRAQSSFSPSTRFPGSLKEQIDEDSGMPSQGGLQDRVDEIAQRYLGLAECSEKVLLGRFAENWNARRSALLRGMQQKLREAMDLPQEWYEYIENGYTQIESSSLGELSVATLEGTAGALNGAELIRFWRDGWRAYGHGLPAWGDIRDAAREITVDWYGG